jgi:hypothetical protein
MSQTVSTPKQLGRYTELTLLGQGGMGAVYRAFDPSLQRTVAIKVMLGQNPEFLARFEREARAVAKLSHPNVVQVYDFGRDEQNNPYFVMELLPGRSLDSLLKEKGPLPALKVVDVLRQAAEGLQAAHAVGIVHRDIKPWNFPLLDLPKFLRGEFRGNTAQLIPRFSRRVNKKIPDGTFGIGLQVRRIHWDFLAYRRYCALL